MSILNFTEKNQLIGDNMPLQTTERYLNETSELLRSMPDRRDLLEALVDLGSELEPFPKELETDENYVPGCTSNVWIHTEVLTDGTVKIQGKSEALIVRGFVKILIESLSGLTTEELRQTPPLIEQFVAQTKISESTLATRANSFGLIYQKILDQQYS